MSMLKQKIREQLKVRPIILGMCALALGIVVIAPASAGTEAPTAFHWMALDDVSNRVVRPPDGFSSEHTGDQESDAPGSPAGDVPAGSGHGNGGHGNNGHGNNADGVDSSDPGQGGGGPNGQQDPSCSGSTCIDDENGGGGGNGTNGNGGRGRP